MIELNVLICATAESPWLKKDTEQTNRLEHCFADFKYTYREQGLVTLQDVKKADIIIGRIAPELIHTAENLKWLHVGTADVRGYDKANLYMNDFVVVTRGDAFASPDDSMEKILVMMEQYVGGDDLENEIELA